MKKVISLCLALMLLVGAAMPAASAGSVLSSQGKALYELGLFRGVGVNADGTPDFGLDLEPTRNQALIMLVRLLGKEQEAMAGTWKIPFKDVTDSMRPYVGYAYANGLTNGTSATTYSGTQPIRVNQYITFVLRALGYESGKDFSVSTPWEFARQVGIIKYEFSEYTTRFDRGDMALISGNALNAKMKSGDMNLIQKLVKEGAVDKNKALSVGFDVQANTGGSIGSIHNLYDVRTFTLFAFMNYTGYNDNNNHTIKGVRKQVREELDAMNLSLSKPNYYEEKKLEDHYYVNALKCMGAAPNFSYINTDGVPSQLRDLPQKLQEFYTEANVAAMHEKYRPDYEKALEAYGGSHAYIAALLDYFRMEPADVSGEFGLEVNLLLAQGRGSGMGQDDLYHGFPVIITGPSDEPNMLNIVHEYSHGFVNDIIDKHSVQVQALSKYQKHGSTASEQGYTRWEEVVKESFVRAFAAYFTPGYGRDYAVGESHRGFVLTSYIFDRIPEFATFDGDIEAFMLVLLKEYQG